jgi:5-methyltetrahydrofolate--homocysteine methyltransferase
MKEYRQLVDALAHCREEQARATVRRLLEEGTPAAEIIAACNQGMAELGDRFQRGECFIPELMFGGMLMKGIMADLSPRLAGDAARNMAGKVVMGSVQYDVHDIGKDIVVMMLRGVGYEVIDLGVDVAPERFVAAVREHQPTVVGMSILLTTCFRSVSATVEAIVQAGLRDHLKLMVGGAAASDLLAQKAGCEFYGKTAMDGVDFVRQVTCLGKAGKG